MLQLPNISFMKILIDQNISFRLIARINAVFSDVAHVRFLNLTDADDFRIFRFAREYGYDAILTLDEDFSNILMSQGTPPKIIWLRLQNASIALQASTLFNNAQTIQQFLNDTDSDCLEIYG